MQPMASETLMQSLELKLVVNTKKKVDLPRETREVPVFEWQRVIILNLDCHNYWLEMLLVEMMWQHHFICIITIHK